MQLSEFRSELNSGVRHPVYVFYGPERYILNLYIKRMGDDVKRADSLKSALSFLTTKNLFTTTAPVVVLEDSKDAVDADWAKLVRSVVVGTLILVYSQIDKRVKFFKDAVTVEFTAPTHETLQMFVQDTLTLPQPVVDFLIDWCNQDAGMLDMACHQLSFCKEPITEGLIRRQIPRLPRDTTFAFVDAVCLRHARQAFDLYQAAPGLELKLLNVLYTRFKQLYLVSYYAHMSDSEISQQTHISFYVCGLLRGFLGVYSTSALLRIVEQIQALENGIKTGKYLLPLAFEALLISILQSPS